MATENKTRYNWFIKKGDTRICRKNIMSTILGIGYANTTGGGFPRLKNRFVYETLGKRQQTIHLIVLLSNLRARLVGIGQTGTVYKASLNKDLRTMFPSMPFNN